MAEPLPNELPLAERARRIRLHALRMGEVQGQGYIAQALCIADMLAVFDSHALHYRAEEPR
jgi:transketolase